PANEATMVVREPSPDTTTPLPGPANRPAAPSDTGTLVSPACFLPPDLARLLAPPEQSGELGRFGGCRILRLVGQGGMGAVFAAEELPLKRQVAVKVLKPELNAYPEMKQRFLREAQAAAALNNDHIIPIFRVGEEGGVSFL